jgi:hypothetical protein
MQREQMTEILVAGCLTGIFDRKRHCWLQGVLADGLKAFARMPADELLCEIRIHCCS